MAVVINIYFSVPVRADLQMLPFPLIFRTLTDNHCALCLAPVFISMFSRP